MSDSSPDRFREADALFDALLDLPTEARDGFLAQATANDAALGAEVRRLLDAHGAAGEFLEQPAGGLAAPLLREAWDASSPPAPDRAGPFRIVSEIGVGGMGTVYLAERDDGQFEQRVALKFVRRRGRDEALIRRFLDERRILARLEHPRIARLIDGGVATDGTPWFAMELVDGERLDAWCDARSLPIAERLALFASVCEAVQYAHQQLVVHRDLKPSNILVTADGSLKLLDFGIATLLDAELQDDGRDAARTMSIAMTPQYAAPEQLRGEPASAATDVYALGVLLYELLTGRLPYDFHGQSLAEIERMIADAEPTLPSETLNAALGNDEHRVRRTRARGTTPDGLRRMLRGDLDAIVMRALHKEPLRRYPSAAALLEDLRRAREGFPVHARPSTAGYRLTRFVARHRTALAAATVLVALLIGGLLRERVLRGRAEAAAQRAEAVGEYIVSVFDVADPYSTGSTRGDTVTARALLDRGVTRVDGELAGQPEVQAELRSVLGRVYANLGLFDRASEQARQALAQRRSLRGPAHPEVAEAMDRLGQVLMRQNRYDEAEPLLREALAQQRRFLGGTAKPTATTLDHLATLLQERGSLAQADTLFREALAARRTRVATASDSIDVAGALNNLALLLFVKGAYDEAEPLYREALTLQTRLIGEDHPSTAMTVQNLAQVQQLRGQLDESEALYRRALDAKRHRLGDLHPSVTISMNNLGNFLVRDRGKADEADSLFRAAIALDRKIFGDKHGYVAAGLNNLATSERARGRFAEAEQLSREAVSIAKAVYPTANKETAVYLNGLGGALLGLGNLDGAAAAYRESLEQYRESLGEGHLFTQTVAVSLARIQRERGDLAEADKLFRGVGVALDSTRASNRGIRVSAEVGIAQIMTARGQARQAVPILEKAVEGAKTGWGPQHWRTAEAKVALGVALTSTGDTGRAEPILREAIATLEPQASAQHRLLTAAREALSATQTRATRQN